jgi:ketosteroid isomerase-like protein
MMPGRAVAEAVVREFIARINAHDASEIVARCTSDHVFVDSLGRQLSGKADLEKAWQGYFSMFPDYRIEVDAMAFDGDLVLTCGNAAGTHAQTGASWRIPAAWRARVVDGQVGGCQVYADNKPVYEILARRA